MNPQKHETAAKNSVVIERPKVDRRFVISKPCGMYKATDEIENK